MRKPMAHPSTIWEKRGSGPDEFNAPHAIANAADGAQKILTDLVTYCTK